MINTKVKHCQENIDNVFFYVIIKHLKYSLFKDHWYDHWSGSKILKRIQIYEAILKTNYGYKYMQPQMYLNVNQH